MTVWYMVILLKFAPGTYHINQEPDLLFTTKEMCEKELYRIMPDILTGACVTMRLKKKMTL